MSKALNKLFENSEKNKNLPSVIKKTNIPPTFTELNRKRLFKGKLPEYDKYEINFQVYEMVRDYIRSGATKKDVNKMFPGKPKLFEAYEKYKSEFKQEKKLDNKQKETDRLNKYIDDMEEHKEFGLSLIRKRAKKIKNDPNKPLYNWLDSKLDEICELIYLCVSPKNICYNLLDKYTTARELKLTPLKFHRWKDITQHIEDLQFAYKTSAEEHINMGKDILEHAALDQKLDMQHASVIRQLSIYHARMAEFLDRKKYGQKVQIIDERPQQKVIGGKDLDKFLSGLSEIAGKVNTPKINSFENVEDVEDEDIEEVEEN